MICGMARENARDAKICLGMRRGKKVADERDRGA